MAAWCRKTLIFFENSAFFGKTTSYGKIFEIMFIVSPINVLCANFVKFVWREIGENVRCFPGKKKQSFALLALWLALSLYCADRAHAKSATAGPAPDSAPDFIQIGSLSAEL